MMGQFTTTSKMYGMVLDFITGFGLVPREILMIGTITIIMAILIIIAEVIIMAAIIMVVATVAAGIAAAGTAAADIIGK